MAASGDTFEIHDGRNRITVSLTDYLSLRNKIKHRLSKFYSNISFTDAGLDGREIKFYCFINGRLVMKLFDAIDWLVYESEGVFDQKYSEFIKRKTKTSLKDVIGKGDGKWRRKTMF